MKTKLQLDLADILKRKHPHGFHAPADIDTFLHFADDDWEHELDIDIDELLAERHAIALIWDTEQLLSHYPHLTEDQAWQVLQECERNYKGEEGLAWDDIAGVVAEMYPEERSESTWEGSINVTIRDTDGYGKSEVLIRLKEMADLISKDMPDVETEPDPNICLIETIHAKI